MTAAPALPVPCDSAKSLARPGFTRDMRMAAHETTEYAAADGNDYAEHERTYQMFLALAKWGVISISILLLLMAYFLT